MHENNFEEHSQMVKTSNGLGGSIIFKVTVE